MQNLSHGQFYLFTFLQRSKQIDWQFLHKESRQILPYQLFIVNTPYVFPMFVNVSLTHLGKALRLTAPRRQEFTVLQEQWGAFQWLPCHWRLSGQRHHSAGVGAAASRAPARGKLRPRAGSDSPTIKALSPWLNLL